MNKCSKKEALVLLNDLLKKPLRRGRKSPDTELYEIAFGDALSYSEWNGETFSIYSHIIHALCCITIIDRSNRQVKQLFSSGSDSFEFEETIGHIAGQKVIETIINEQNDLCICLENCEITFLASTAEDEIWRYFTLTHDGNNPHLVATKKYMYLV